MRYISDTLREINGGEFIEEVSEEFADLVKMVRDTGKGGTLTISLKVKPNKGSKKTVTVDYDYKAKSPEFDRPTQFFFVGGDGSLLADNPDQKKLPFRDVAEDPGKIRQHVDTETGEIRTVVN